MPYENPYLKLTKAFDRELSQLKSSLIEVADGKPIKLIMVTSSKPGEGKTLASISIAKTLAQAKDVKVLLIDVNLKSPKLHEIFNLKPQPGLSDLVLAPEQSDGVCQPSGIANLDVMTNGSCEHHTNWLFDADNLAATLKTLGQKYDHVVVDTSHFLGSSEVSLICPLFDAVLLVVECETTKWQVVNTVAQKIQKSGANLLGTVLNRRKFYIPGFFYG